jgi:hypothetical protein
MSESFDLILARAEGSLAELQAATADARRVALQFGREIGEIGRALTLHADLAPRVQAFVARTAPLVRLDPGIWIWLHRVYDAAESRSSDTDEYLRALSMRSALEFFRDLYRDSVAGDYVAGIDIGDTDEQLKEWGAEQYLAEVPPGYPPSHVWWHQSLSGK